MDKQARSLENKFELRFVLAGAKKTSSLQMKFVQKKSAEDVTSCPFAHPQVCICDMEVLLREDARAAACCTTTGRFFKRWSERESEGGSY